MTNPELADKILQYLNNTPLSTNTGPIAQALGEPLSEVNTSMVEIIRSYPIWFNTRNLSSREVVGFILKNEYYGELKSIIRAGGFTAMAKARQDKSQKDQEKEQLQIDAWKAIVLNAKAAEEQAKIAREQADTAKEEAIAAGHNAFIAEGAAKHAKRIANWSLFFGIISVLAAVASAIAAFLALKK